jgi:cytochrome c6
MKLFISTLVVTFALAMAVPVMAQDSAALYNSKCKICHGADGKGTAAGHKLGVRAFSSPEVAKMSDEELESVVKSGKNKMPKYTGKLTEDQIKGLIKYVRTLK